MTQRSAFFLSPEAPSLQGGGGPMRSASLLEYLRRKYDVNVASFTLPHHSQSMTARVTRNAIRWVRGRPPLFDRYSGMEHQVILGRHYDVAVIEHFWCASYAAAVRPHTDLLVLDLHNIESRLAHSTGGPAFRRFAHAYERLEREWLPRFDMILVASEEDRRHVNHPNVIVYPNALPEIDAPDVMEPSGIIFSGNLEYHSNVQAVRWFHKQVWPRVREHTEWRIVGRNPHAIAGIIKGDDRIHVTGPVEDAMAHIAQAQVAIVPLLSGSGTRFKILEAWAARRAVVSTSIGAEGLGACPDEHLLIADDAKAFANHVLFALKTPEARTKLGENGRALYRERFTWRVAWRALEQAGF
jgi:glycosyltransferase involved in cell wall biosynthesis